MNIKNDCICEDDNKLKQAVCPLHGGPAYRSHQSKSMDTKSKLVEKVTDPELVCKAAELGAQDQNDMLAQGKSVEGEWKGFDKLWAKVSLSLESVTHGSYDVETLTERYKEWFGRDLKTFVEPLLAKARESGYAAAVEEVQQHLRDVGTIYDTSRTGDYYAMIKDIDAYVSRMSPKSPKEE